MKTSNIRRNAGLAASAIALSVTLAACGDDATETEPNDTASASPAEEETPAEEPTEDHREHGAGVGVDVGELRGGRVAAADGAEQDGLRGVQRGAGDEGVRPQARRAHLGDGGRGGDGDEQRCGHGNGSWCAVRGPPPAPGTLSRRPSQADVSGVPT